MRGKNFCRDGYVDMVDETSPARRNNERLASLSEDYVGMAETAQAQRNTERRVSFSDDCAPLVELQSEASSFAQGTAAGTSTQMSRMRFAEPSETVIFSDWDDTLFPTTEIFDRWGISSRKETWGEICLIADQEQQLLRWQNMLRRYLTVACSLSDGVIVITNARRPWVDDCIQQFAPNVADFFHGERSQIRVVYAREVLTHRKQFLQQAIACEAVHVENLVTQEEHDENQTRSKIVAMQREVKAFYSKYPKQSWKNILSFGDQPYEHDALHEVTFQRDSPAREQLRTKGIILKAEPTISHLTYSLDVRCHLTPGCVHFDGDIDMDFNKCGKLLGDHMKIVADALGVNARPGIEVPQELWDTPMQQRNDESHIESIGAFVLAARDAMWE